MRQRITRDRQEPDAENTDAVVSLYADALRLLQDTLAAAWFTQNSTRDADANVRLSSAHLAYAIFSHGRAMKLLYDGGDAEQMPTHMRAMFEAMITLQYIILLHPEKAADIMDVVPFEQLRDANEYSRGTEFLAPLKEQCLEVIRRRPDVIAHRADKDDILAGNRSIPYGEIRKRMSFPNVKSMIHELHRFDPGWSPDLYTTIYRLGSKFNHPSGSVTRKAIAWIREDDSVAFGLEPSLAGGVDFFVQGSGYTIGTAGIIESLFELASREQLAEKYAEWIARREQVLEPLRQSGYIVHVTGRD